MKTLIDFLNECGAGPAGAATPANTMGMGNPGVVNGTGAQGENVILTEPTAKTKKEKKKKGEK